VSRGEYAQGLSLLQQTLATAQEIGSQALEVISLNNLGFAYSYQGDFAQSLDVYERALTLARQMGLRSQEAYALANKGKTYHDQAQFDQALDHYQQALAIFQELGEKPGEVNVRRNLGEFYKTIGQYPQALEQYQQALGLTQEMGDRILEGQLLSRMGEIYERQGQDDQALALYQEALQKQQAIGYRHGESYTLRLLGRFHASQGKSAEALTALQQSLQIAQAIGATLLEVQVQTELGAVYAQQEQFDQAVAVLQPALATSARIGDRASNAIALSHLGELYARQDQPALAIFFYKQSVNATEAIRQSINGLSQEQQQSYTDTVANTYRQLADLLLSQDRVLEAQQVLDLLKVQELEDYLQNVRGTTRTASGIEYWQPEQAILARYQRLQENAVELGQELAQLTAKQAAGSLSAEQTARLQELTRLQAELAQQFNAFVDSPEIQDFLDQLTRRAYDQTVKLDSLARQQDNLRTLNAALFYPLVLEDRLELVLMTPDSEPIRRTVEGVGREQLNAAITEFNRALQVPPRDAVTPAQELYRWLIEPIEAELAAAGVETILYSPDGALRYVPLAALHDGEQWLVERYRINNITAVSLEEFDTQPPETPTILAAAFADESVVYPVEGIDYRGLPYAGEEVAQLKSTLPATTSLLNQDFGLERVLPEMGRFNILHFATHAAFVPGDPRESFILFGNGDTPNLKDIESWPLANVDLVVLSACETGLGGYDNNGEQILGLGYQFQNRGARAVVASLWQVNDGSTQVLMNAFYAGLSRGLGKAEALRQAQVSLIAGESGADLGHPYYWAPFILIGNGL
ncbi:MAG TPA: CHAT domain-containing protein, partial [Trichocoleus sp.]